MGTTMTVTEQPPKRAPIWICRVIVRNINTAFLVAVSLQSSLILITGLLVFFGSDVFPADFSDVPLDLPKDPAYRRVKAWNLRNSDPSEPIYQPGFVDQDSISRQHPADLLEMYYEIDGTEEEAGIFTAENMALIYQFEVGLTKLPNYEDFCVWDSEQKCRPIQSLVPLLIDPAMQAKCNSSIGKKCEPHELFSDEHIQMTLEKFAKDPDFKSTLMDHLDRKTDLEIFPIRSKTFRSYMIVSWMVYKNASRGPEPESTKDYASTVVAPYFWEHSQAGLKSEGAGLSFYYYNPFLYYDRLRIQVIADLMLATGSFCFVFLFLWMQSKSVFITAMGIYGIFTSFLGANLLYRYVFDFHYFGVFNVLSVFIILGIGVDDIFVFNDAWSATADNHYEHLEDRLSHAYRKSALSMFITSFTTTAAFVVNAFSPLLAISSFGLFSACLVLVNYIAVVTAFPTIVAFHHLRIKSRCCLCCPQFMCANGREENPGHSNLAANKKAIGSLSPDKTLTENEDLSKLPTKSHSNEENSLKAETLENMQNETRQKRANRLSKRICRFYEGMVWEPGVQALFLMLLAGALGFLAYSATGLKVDSDPVKLYTEAHPLGWALGKRRREFDLPRFYQDLQYTQLMFVWGIKDIDRDGCHKTDWKNCKGRVIWDDNFDLNPYHAQRDLLWFCKYLRNLNKKDIVKLRIKTHGEESVPDVKCFIEDMDSYFEDEFARTVYTSQRLTGLPSTDSKIEALMMRYPDLYQISQINKNPFFSRYFETAMLYWLHGGYKFLTHAQFLKKDKTKDPEQEENNRRFLSQLSTEQLKSLAKRKNEIETELRAAPTRFKEFGWLVGNSLNSSDILETILSGNWSLTYGTKLRYAAVIVNTTVPAFTGYEEGLPVLDDWEQFFDRAKVRMSPGLQGGFFATPDKNEISSGMHHWLKVQQTLTTNALKGVIISLCLALPVLILSTDDFLVGGLATFIICCTSLSVIGVIPLAGWKLGVLESLNLTLVVGLAIDYIVHVAEGYHLSQKNTRKEKVQEVLQNIGISVISGAISTLGASVFMLFAKIAFFMQFGLFIFCTVGFSLLYSLGMFIVLLALIGPEDDRFSVSTLLRKVRSKLRKLSEGRKEPGNSDGSLKFDQSKLDQLNQSDLEKLRSLLIQSQSLGDNSNELLTIANDESRPETRRSRSKSIDDDNLSSGYDSATSRKVAPLPPVRDIFQQRTEESMSQVQSDISLTDLSDLEDVFSPKGARLLEGYKDSAGSSTGEDSGFETSSSREGRKSRSAVGPRSQIPPSKRGGNCQPDRKITPIPEETNSISSNHRRRKSSNSSKTKSSSSLQVDENLQNGTLVQGTAGPLPSIDTSVQRPRLTSLGSSNLAELEAEQYI